ncbi:Thrombospondin type 1 domain family protein [Brugia pahangi]
MCNLLYEITNSEADEKYQWKKVPKNPSLKRSKNFLVKFTKQPIETLCIRSHNNTVYLGTKPITSITLITIDQCHDTCLELYPYCVAVIFYKIITPLCYLFNKSSIYRDVVLYPEKPLAEHDVINTIEIVANCHEFNAVPPLADTFTASSDKVSRIKRATNFGNRIKRMGLWSQWTKCRNGYQIRSQPCEYGRLIQKRQCSKKSSTEIPFFVHPSSFLPYPPQPYEHPNNKSPEYERRLSEHMKQLHRLRQNCCERQEWYRKHVGKDYIDFCGHSCPPSSLLDVEQDPEQLLHNEKQQQSVFSEEPISRIQEYRKGQSDEIVMLSAPVSLLPDYESEWKNEQQQSSIKMHLPNLNGEVSSDLPQEVQTATGNHEGTETMNYIRTYEEYFHNLQPQLGQTIDETRKPTLPNDKKEQAHRLSNSQEYHGHEDHDDHYQQYSQQDEFMNDRDGIIQEDYYPEHNKNKQPINPENDNTKEGEFDGTDYGYDYDSQERTAVTTYEEQGSPSEITNKQFSHQNYPYDSRTETFSSTLVPHVHFNQQPNLIQSMNERHNFTDLPLQERPQHLGAPSENFYHQKQQFPESLPEDFNHEQQIYSQSSGSELDEYYRRQQLESTVSPEEYHRQQQAHPQPSGSELDEYYRQHQLQSTIFPEEYAREHPQPSGPELDEYYRRQQLQSTISPEEYHRQQQAHPQPSASELDEYYRQQQLQSTISPEEYHRQQQAHPQPSGSELDEYYRRQQLESTVSPEEYHRQQQAHPQPSASELDEYYRQQQLQSTISPEEYHRQQQAHPQPSGSELDEYYRRQQLESTVSPEEYHRQQQAHPQPSGSELDEYYRRQQLQSTISPEEYAREHPQPSGSELDEYYRQQQLQSTIFPEEYAREHPQPSGPELDEYYRRQQLQSTISPEEYHRQQQAHPQPSGSELDEYYRQQQLQSTISPEEYHRQQQAHPQPSGSELDEYYRRQQLESTVSPEEYHRQQQAHPQPSGSELDEYYRRQQLQSTISPEEYAREHPQPSGSELDEYYRRQQLESTVSPEDYHRQQQAHPQPSGSELDEYYRRQQLESTVSPEEYHRQQQAHPQPSGSELDEYYRRQQLQSTISPKEYAREHPQPSGSELDEYYRRQQLESTVSPEDYHRQQQAHPQPSGSELDEYYRRQQLESTVSPEEYHRQQQAHPQPSGSELDEYYRRQQLQSTISPEEYRHEQPQLSGSELDEYYRSQQHYSGKGRQDSLEARHYPDSSRDLIHEQQQSSYVQGWNLWTTWSICPVTCGDSVQIRRRTCLSRTGINCLGEITQQRPCYFRPCDMWTDWNDNCGSCANH